MSPEAGVALRLVRARGSASSVELFGSLASELEGTRGDGAPAWSVARRLAADHVKAAREQAHAEGRSVGIDALKGLRLQRSFPCLGMLRVVSERGRMVEVSCDSCGQSLGVSTPRDPRDDDEKPRRRRSNPQPGDPGMPF